MVKLYTALSSGRQRRRQSQTMRSRPPPRVPWLGRQGSSGARTRCRGSPRRARGRTASSACTRSGARLSARCGQVQSRPARRRHRVGRRRLPDAARPDCCARRAPRPAAPWPRHEASCARPSALRHTLAQANCSELAPGGTRSPGGRPRRSWRRTRAAAAAPAGPRRRRAGARARRTPGSAPARGRSAHTAARSRPPP